MGEIIAFILGILFKALAAAAAGKFVAYVLANIKDWPRVLHYLYEHGGKSLVCDQCRLGTPESVDSIH